MIRPAKYADIPRLMAMLVTLNGRSKYAGRATVCPKAAEQMLMGLIAGQNQNGPQASFIRVLEIDGKVDGFMAGALNRIYNIGDKLCAADLFLINEGGTVKGAVKLIDAYIDWASSNPKVIEIGLSWSDAVANSKGAVSVYKHKGAVLSGEQYEIRIDLPNRIAA